MIHWCLMSNEQYFSYIRDKNKFTINKSCRSKGGTGMIIWAEVDYHGENYILDRVGQFCLQKGSQLSTSYWELLRGFHSTYKRHSIASCPKVRCVTKLAANALSDGLLYPPQHRNYVLFQYHVVPLWGYNNL